MAPLRIACVPIVLLATACSSVSPLLGTYKCDRIVRTDEGDLHSWTYELELRKEGECWLIGLPDRAEGTPWFPVGRWEHHAPKDGPETVTVFQSAYDPSRLRLDLAVVGLGAETKLVSGDREWQFRRVR